MYCFKIFYTLKPSTHIKIHFKITPTCFGPTVVLRQHAAAEPQCNVLISDQWQLWDRNDVLPDDDPVRPKHVGVILK
jgi:hypothetical protein